MAAERQSPRKAASSFLWLQMESNNDAIVLNFSDGGLGFRATNPVMQSGIIRFSFSDNGQHIETGGELAWIDPTKRIGGLSFASLPSIERERIRRWMNRMATPEGSPVTTEPSIPSRPGPVPRAENSAPMNSEPAFRVPPPSVPLSQSVSPGFALFEDNARRAPGPWDEEISYQNSGTRFFRGFLAGAVVSGMVAAILFFAYSNRTKDWRIQLAERLGISTPAPQAASAPPASAPVTPPAPSAPAPTGAPLAPSPAPAAQPGPPAAGSAQTPAAPAPSAQSADSDVSNSDAADSDASIAKGHAAKEAAGAAGESRRRTHAPAKTPPNGADSGEEDLALAQRYLGDRSSTASRAAATGFLWSAVQKGNLEAEITLADMYARGDGVPKNCDQARVLLRAASRRGSAEASEELGQILRRGCR